MLLLIKVNRAASQSVVHRGFVSNPGPGPLVEQEVLSVPEGDKLVPLELFESLPQLGGFQGELKIKVRTWALLIFNGSLGKTLIILATFEGYAVEPFYAYLT